MITILCTRVLTRSTPERGESVSGPERRRSSKLVVCPMLTMLTLAADAALRTVRYTRSAGSASEACECGKTASKSATYAPRPLLTHHGPSVSLSRPTGP
eukprot:1795800-Prymnesium_polylepis.1